MKSKTLALVALIIVTAFLLISVIAPQTASASMNWTDTGGGVSSYSIRALAYDSEHNILYAGCHDNLTDTGKGVWKYDGTTWTDTGGGVSSYSISALAYDSAHNILYAGCYEVVGENYSDKGFWKYDGTTWASAPGLGRSTSIHSLAYDSAHNMLYGGTNSYGVWKYNGTTWTNTGGAVSSYFIRSLAYDSVHNVLYAGTYNYYGGSYGVWKYSGTTWTNTGGGVSNLSIESLAYDSVHNVLYAGTNNYGGGYGVWKYDGTTWTNTGGGVSSHSIYSLAYDSTNNRLYAGTPDGVWYYSDDTPPSPTPLTPTSRTWGHDSIGVTAPAQNWYLAEGCTNGGFETWVLVQNPNNRAADVQLTYMTPAGTVTGPSANLPPNSRKSFNVGDKVSGQWEVSTKVHADKPVIAERAVYGPGRAWGTDSIGASETSKTWYLAEGCTSGGFESWILVQNPNDKPAEVSLKYMTPEGQKPGPSVTLPANSRKTFNIADKVPNNWNVSTFVSSKEPVVAERAVYWNSRKGAHDSIGVTDPEETWYLAEGCTNGGFETWILVQNPGDSAASVDLSFMTETGEKPGPHLDLAPHSRKTFNVGETVPNDWSVSTKVTSKQPVIAERAVYWNGRIEGHDSIGTTTPAKTWYLAEGCTGAGFETWVLVQNPNSSEASVSLTYMTPSGQVTGPSETIPANSRKTFNVAETAPGVFEVSTKVTSNVPVITERAMYGSKEIAPPPKVPGVVSMLKADAENTLVNAGFTVTVINQATPDPTKVGRVISQDPPAQSEAPAGSAVKIYVGVTP